MIKTVLFDLDGTLLNMGESAFEKEYLRRMVLFLEQRYPGQGKALVKAVGYGAEAMKKSDGTRRNALIFMARRHSIMLFNITATAFLPVGSTTRNAILIAAVGFYGSGWFFRIFAVLQKCRKELSKNNLSY